MVRDFIKDKNYFDSVINRDSMRIDKRLNKLKNGQINEDRVAIVKSDMSGTYKNNLIAKYSRGDNMNSAKVIADYTDAVDLMNEVWSPRAWNMVHNVSKTKNIVLNQYTFSGYLDMTRMLSLATLINVPMSYVDTLISIIDGDEVKDFLLEFLIRYFRPERPEITKESYSEFFHVNERLGTLKEIIKEDNSVKAQEKLKHFLEKEWYPSFKGTPLYNAHTNKHDIYVGYWCFQAAAITKIMNLDDSSFRDNKYYPSDLV